MDDIKFLEAQIKDLKNELIDHSWIKNIFPNVKEYDNCGHRFTRMAEILPEIKIIHEAWNR